MQYKKILVTGGTGLVGKSLKNILPDAIYLSSKDCNLTSKKEIDNLLYSYEPDVVIHLAAKVGGIMDNIKYPVQYFNENVLMNTLLVQSSYEFGIKRFIGILSTCIYPDVVNVYPMSEDMIHAGPPTTTNFSYAYAKRCMAVQIEAYNKQYGLNYQYLIPCNLYGEYDKYGDNSHFVASLIKKIYIAKKTNQNSIELFGTGTPLRQFMHADDLAYVIKYCIENEIYNNMNIATNETLSIREIANIALEACSMNNLEIKFNTNLPDGQYQKDVSTEVLKKIIPNFNPLSLFDGIKKTYNNINLEF
jgi:GDP-L-fucose synthase